MALAGVAKSELRNLTYQQYGENATSNLDFTATMVNTFVNEAVQEFALRSGCVLGTFRAARPDGTGVQSGVGALLQIQTGMFEVTQVRQYRIRSNANWYTLTPLDRSQLPFRYGPNWLSSTDAVYTSPKQHGWYREDANHIGFMPALIRYATAGTVVVLGRKVPARMANDTTISDVPAEWCPGVVSIACRKMAERDADADAEGARKVEFESIAERYVQMAVGGRPFDKED